MASDWVIYGATGYTGTLLAEEAVRRGHRPLLCGRSAQKLRPLAERLQLPFTAVSLDDAKGLRAAFAGKVAVLHAAGPFVVTSAPIADACIASGASYLDITGELPVFTALYARHDEAKRAGVALIPGVGFDVVPSDCLLAYVAAKCPGATTLTLALAAIGQPSSGTLKSILGLISLGNLQRNKAQLQSAPFGKGVRKVRFSTRESWAVPVPVGDLESAYRASGVPNIHTYLAVPSAIARTLRFGWPLMVPARPIAAALLTGPLKKTAESFLEKRFTGPDEAARARGSSALWARAEGPHGTVDAWLDTAEGYQLTMLAGVRAVERVLANRPIGGLTPAQAFGADFVLELPGSVRRDVL